MSAKEKTDEIMLPKYDFVFKWLFGDEKSDVILISFLEAVLEKDIKSVKLKNPTKLKQNEDDKLTILDIKAQLENGEIIDIEMQARNIPELRSRITYYSAGMITEQLEKSEKYSDLKPSITIMIVAETLILESDKCHNVFCMSEKDEHFPFNDLQEIHILDLSRIENGVSEKLSNWLKFINSEKKEDFMAVAKKDKAIGMAFDKLQVMSVNKHRREIYEAQLKQKRDYWSIQDGLKRQERELGIQEGMQQGMQQLLELWEKGVSLSEAKKMVYAR